MEKHRQYVYTTSQPSCVLTHKACNLAIAIDSAYFVLHRVCYSSYHALHCRLSMHNQTLPLWKAWPLYCCLTIFTKPETILPSGTQIFWYWSSKHSTSLSSLLYDCLKSVSCLPCSKHVTSDVLAHKACNLTNTKSVVAKTKSTL